VEGSKYLPFKTDGDNPVALRGVFYQGKVCTNAFHLSSIFKLFVVSFRISFEFWVQYN